jgi:dethiobiotin synthetase
MIEKPQHGLFITGTDTGVGKTYVTALIARSLVKSGKRVGVYKPVASGCDIVDGERISEDAEILHAAIGGEVGIDNICPQRFAAPLAPHLAARGEAKSVDADLLRSGISFWNNRCDILLVEGVGGLMSPVSDEDYTADLACDFGYPVVIVAPNTLGVINQTLQTLITASTFRDGLEVAGIVLNDVQALDHDSDPSIDSNRQQLESHCIPPVLTHVNWQASEIDTEIDWIGISRRRSSCMSDHQ